MGCFSFLCKECSKGIKSNSFQGEKVKLYLLKNGEIIDSMEGQYDSYGRVFKGGTQVSTVEHQLMESIHWCMGWSKVCDLIFMSDKSNGIAAIHSKCYKDLIPVTRSENDPNQGWGENGEHFSDCNTEDDLFEEEKK